MVRDQADKIFKSEYEGAGAVIREVPTGSSARDLITVFVGKRVPYTVAFSDKAPSGFLPAKSAHHGSSAFPLFVHVFYPFKAELPRLCLFFRPEHSGSFLPDGSLGVKVGYGYNDLNAVRVAEVVGYGLYGTAIGLYSVKRRSGFWG